jgi:hypothetical protein
MTEPVSLQTLLTYLTLISVPVGVFYHIMTLRNTRRNQDQQLETRQAQLFMSLYNRLSDKNFNQDWMDAVSLTINSQEEYMHLFYDTEKRTEIGSAVNALFAYFEGIGVLIKRGLVDISLVDDLMSSYILMTWNKYGPFIKEQQESANRPELWEHFEYLANEIKKVYVTQHGFEFKY